MLELLWYQKCNLWLINVIISMSSFRRIIISTNYIAKTAIKWTTAFYAVLGLISVFVSFEELFSEEISVCDKIKISLIVLIGIWFICALIVSFIVVIRNRNKVLDGKNGKGVFLIYGDLFDSKIVKDEKRYICFAVNRCFDTIVDDKLIASKSVHGIAFNRLYLQNGLTPEKLNDAIKGSIKGNPSFEIVPRSRKCEGNLKRYEVGTYANLQIDNKLNYLLLGLTWFDSNLNAYASKQDYVYAVQRMIEMINIEAQGFPVLMPIIGTGFSRTDLNERDALRYMIESFRININKITSDIYIIVHESAKNRVSIVDL